MLNVIRKTAGAGTWTEFDFSQGDNVPTTVIRVKNLTAGNILVADKAGAQDAEAAIVPVGCVEDLRAFSNRQYAPIVIQKWYVKAESAGTVELRGVW